MTGTSSKARGFTLFELVVALAIFSLVLIIMLGIFSRFVANQRLGIAEQQLQEDLRIALELMSREIRTGYGSTFESSGTPAQLLLRNQDGRCVRYRFAQDPDNFRLVRGEVATTDPCAGADYTNQEQTVTEFSAGSQLENVRFTTRTATIDTAVTPPQLTEQGYVTVNLTLRRRGANQPVHVQSTIASRNIIPYVQP